MINKILVRYFEGDASEEEIITLEIWRNESPDNEREFQELKQVWDATLDLNNIKRLDVESDLKLVKQRALTNQVEPPVRKIYSFRKIAAILLPLFVFGLGAYFYLFNRPSKDGFYTLSDGTKVWVNGDAKLTFPNHFDGNTRTVQLSGEAFFEVAKNPNKPFIIQTESTQVEVLGTSFDVNENDVQTTVIVATGKVKFYNKNKPSDLVYLTPGEKGIFDGKHISEEDNQNINYAAWHTGHFEFVDKPIREVVSELSSYYGEIDISKKIDSNCLFKGTFDKEPVESIIETLELSCGQ